MVTNSFSGWGSGDSETHSYFVTGPKPEPKPFDFQWWLVFSTATRSNIALPKVALLLGEGGEWLELNEEVAFQLSLCSLVPFSSFKWLILPSSLWWYLGPPPSFSSLRQMDLSFVGWDFRRGGGGTKSIPLRRLLLPINTITINNKKKSYLYCAL